MIYPSVGQYTEAIKLAEQSPEDYFATKTTLRPVLGADGNPVMSSGNFAVVFKMQDTDGKIFALKCFTRDQEGRNESYRLIADELQYVESEYLTKIQYLENELFVDTGTVENEFPVLLMDWVEGETLDKYIKNHISEPLCLEMLACDFAYLADWLLKQPFAHGDLKPDNILVKDDGSIVLIDYDGMYVPKMRGQKARELGSPDFRHPQRTEDDFDEHIDDFAVVTILLSLKALSLNNKLLETLNAKDCVLLHTQDFSNLAQSAADQKLQELIYDKIFARIYAMFVVVLAEKVMDDEGKMMLSKTVSMIDKDELEQKFIEYLWEKGNGSQSVLEKIYSVAQKLSGKGYVKAHYFLGICYFWGFGGAEQNYKNAIDLYIKSAEQGFTRAQYNLGYCYDLGEGVSQDYNKAVEWYSKASVDSCYRYNWGECYEYALRQYDKAFDFYKNASEYSLYNQYNVGRCYKYGIGVEKNLEKAVELLQAPADFGIDVAEYELGDCYYYGYGVQKNIQMAIKLFQRAWENGGNKDALYVLNYLSTYIYHYPLWDAKKIKSSDVERLCREKEGYDLMDGMYNSDKSDERRTLDYKIAFQLIEKAAEMGNPEAQCRLGKCYEKGYGVKQNHKAVEMWYTKAANQEYLKAFLYFAEFYASIWCEEALAVEWYTKAAERGDAYAQYMLGYYYRYGMMIDRDDSKAVEWLTKAAEQGNTYAQKELGSYNVSEEQDCQKATEWYTKAAEQGCAGTNDLPF